MRVIVVGGKGVIGSAVVKELSERHEVLIAGRSSGDLHCDMTSEVSIRQMYEKAGKFDAVVVTAGMVQFDPFSEMTPAKYQIGLNSKLMGQVNLVLIGSSYIADRGSFTLTSGSLSDDPIKAGSGASMVNGAIDSFTKAVSIELIRGVRINAVSPTIVTESLKDFGGYFIGFESVPAAKAALAYSKSVDGLQTGQIYRVS